MRRPRAWRITMWTSLAATVLLAGAAIGARSWYGWWVDGQGRLVGFAGGSLTFGRIQSSAGAGWQTGAWGADRFWVEYWTNGSDWTLDTSLLTIAGAPFVVCALSTFMVYRTRRRPGHCPNCGYDRSGLPTDAPCPECGRAARA